MRFYDRKAVNPNSSSVQVSFASKLLPVDHSGLYLQVKYIKKMAPDGLTFGEPFVEITTLFGNKYYPAFTMILSVLTECS